MSLLIITSHFSSKKDMREGENPSLIMQAVGLHRFATCSEAGMIAGLSMELTISLVGW
jgi:hypothetical protein